MNPSLFSSICISSRPSNVRVATPPADPADGRDPGAIALAVLEDGMPAPTLVTRRSRKAPAPLFRDIAVGWRIGDIGRVPGWA